MSPYLETAKEIFDWLASLQVRHQTVDAAVEGNSYVFSFVHPTKGKLTARVPVADSEVISVEGVVFTRLDTKPGKLIFETLDGGGIFDPVDGRVQGEHYSTTHFAALAAILFCEDHQERYLKAATEAIAFHIRTSVSEYAPVANWMYHWDFQNYAFVVAYRLLRSHLPGDLRKSWEKAIKRWKSNDKNKLTNWAAMRAWAYLERYRLFKHPADYLKSIWNLRYVARARLDDGCFDDHPRLSRPIQYHIFTIALLHRYLMLRESPAVRRWFREGLEYFIPFIDPEGEFNYLGRGQRQIFGYAAAIYALEAAFFTMGHEKYRLLAQSIFKYLLQYKNKEGYFPLVLNRENDEARSGWYDYHHLTVYNAFLGVWLGLAHRLEQTSSVQPEKSHSAGERHPFYARPSGVVVYASPRYFAAFYSGLPEYLCEAGITPYHVWWRKLGLVFSSPGGATPALFGKWSHPDAEQNLLAPIARIGEKWLVPAGKTAARFDFNSERLEMKYDYGSFQVSRTVEFTPQALKFEDHIYFSETATYDEFRWFNFPVALEFISVELQEQENGFSLFSKNGGKLIVEINGLDTSGIELLDELYCSTGRVRPLTCRSINCHQEKGETRTIRFSIEEPSGTNIATHESHLYKLSV